MGNPSLSGTTPVTTRLHRKFLRSMYISLALGCICLVYAEWTLIPEIGWFAIAIGLLIGVAYLFEEKRSLSNGWANVFGGIIAVFAGAWFAFQTIRPTGGLVKNIPWPLSMLPYVGPLLMILLPFKLFRPKKTADFWGIENVQATRENRL